MNLTASKMGRATQRGRFAGEGGLDRIILGFVDDLNECSDPSLLTRTLQRGLAQIGCEKYAYRALRLPNKEVFFRTTYDDRWVKYYLDKSYGDIDPVVIAANQTVLPYTWQEALYTYGQDRRQDCLFQEARAFGINHGITIPIHGRRGELATLSVIPDVARIGFARFFEAHKHYLHLLALNYHAALTNLFERDAETDEIRLTLRQRECLTWTARGKTAWEVGEIIGVSDETVVTHLNRAAEKLNVFGKHHAVVKATILGLIKP